MVEVERISPFLKRQEQTKHNSVCVGIPELFYVEVINVAYALGLLAKGEQ
jgi:hypothetical protein